MLHICILCILWTCLEISELAYNSLAISLSLYKVCALLSTTRLRD